MSQIAFTGSASRIQNQCYICTQQRPPPPCAHAWYRHYHYTTESSMTIHSTMYSCTVTARAASLECKSMHAVRQCQWREPPRGGSARCYNPKQSTKAYARAASPPARMLALCNRRRVTSHLRPSHRRALADLSDRPNDPPSSPSLPTPRGTQGTRRRRPRPPTSASPAGVSPQYAWKSTSPQRGRRSSISRGWRGLQARLTLMGTSVCACRR